MACESCGEKPKKCNKDFTKAIVEINNPGQITLMRKVTIPASMGDDTTVPPVVGKYKNVLLFYEANSKSYLYSSDGIPTLLANGLTDYEQAVNLPQINGVTLVGDKTATQLGLQDKLTAGANISIDADNVISAVDTTYGPATDSTIGLVKPGDGLEVTTDGTLSVDDVAFVFDTVADMKASTDLKAGDYAKTGGFYAVNDGGGALYKITNTGTANEMDVITVGSLYANLQHNDVVYVKQLGAYGDNTHDDTAIIDRCLELVNHVIVNKSDAPYLAKYLKLNDGKSIEGECLPYVQINLSRDGSSVVSRFYNNTSMDKIYLNSLDTNLNNNRVDLRDSNIRISNSRLEGFRADSHNAWGILLTGAKNVTIDNCYFKNNTQSDIAIVDGTENVVIKNCFGSSLHINLEPSGSTDKIKNVKIANSEIAELDIRENTYTDTGCQNISVSNCVIDVLEYDGGKTVLTNCTIRTLQPQAGDPMGGEVKFINSINVVKPLIRDIYIDNFTPATTATTEWFVQSQPSALDACYSYDILNDNPVFTLNTNYVQRTTSIRHSDISVDSAKTYMLRINASVDYTQGGTNISKNIVLRQYDSNDVLLTDIKPSMFRGKSGSLVPMHEECCLFKVADDASKIRVIVRNADYGKQKFMVRSIELFEITGNEACSNMPDSPLLRNKRVFNGTTVSAGMNYKVGDTMYYEEPTSYIGKVCSSVTDYTATWTDFGALGA